MTKSDKLWKQVEMYLGDTLWPVQMNDELKAILAWGTLTLQKKKLQKLPLSITTEPNTIFTIHHHVSTTGAAIIFQLIIQNCIPSSITVEYYPPSSITIKCYPTPCNHHYHHHRHHLPTHHPRPDLSCSDVRTKWSWACDLPCWASFLFLSLFPFLLFGLPFSSFLFGVIFQFTGSQFFCIWPCCVSFHQALLVSGLPFPSGSCFLLPWFWTASLLPFLVNSSSNLSWGRFFLGSKFWVNWGALFRTFCASYATHCNAITFKKHTIQ